MSSPCDEYIKLVEKTAEEDGIELDSEALECIHFLVKQVITESECEYLLRLGGKALAPLVICVGVDILDRYP